MEIHFCDICNESVPDSDLQADRAVVRNGRFICAACEGAMSPEGVLDVASGGVAVAAGGVLVSPRSVAPARAAGVTRADAEASAPGARSGVFFASALAGLAILFAGGVLMTMKARVDRLEQESAVAMGALRDELEYTARSLESDVEAARSFSLEELDDLQDDLALLRSESREDLAASRELAGELRESVGDLGDRFRALDHRVTEVTRRGLDLAEVRAELAVLDEELRGLGDRLMTVEERAALAAIATEDAAEGPPAWHGLLVELTSDNAGARWSAVQALGETGDSAVVPHLTTALDDDDIFVRMAAARILGDLHALVAIPALIETLADEEASVREAAVVTLRILSGRNFRFDPTASEPERRRRADSWRDWWKRNGEALLAGGQ